MILAICGAKSSWIAFLCIQGNDARKVGWLWRHFSFSRLLRQGRPSLRGETSHVYTHVRTHARTSEGWSHISGSWERGVFVYCLHDHMRTCVQRATHIDLDQREPWKEAQRQNVSPRLYPSILPQKNGGFEEALWREVYHLESLKTKCGMSYGPEVESKWRKGKISQHSWQFFTEI